MTTPQIPEHWSPEEALAVFEFVNDLLDSIWARYGLCIQALLASDRVTAQDTLQLDLFDPNDPLPF
jgi:hypothetical protein